MSESGKIVLVVGNGFDLDLGLKTSYKNFWESEYCPKNYPSPIIRHLNGKWYKDLNAVRWYDLENELHTFALSGDKSDVISEEERSFLQRNSEYDLYNEYIFLSRCNTFNSLVNKGCIRVESIPNIKVNVPYHSHYLCPVGWRNKQSLQLIKDGLCKYLKSVEFSFKTNYNTTVAYNVLQSLFCSLEAGASLDIFSFNYTHFPDLGIRLDVPVHYMHGSCEDGKVIIGTRDDLSIEKDYDYLQKAMDPYFNPPALVKSLREADEVIFFGHSLGENDKQYFTSFFRHSASFDSQQSKDITIFTFDQTAEDDIKRSLNKMTDGNLSVLFSNNNLMFIKTAAIADDKQKLLEFLLRHESDERFARDLVGKLLKSR